MRCKYKTFARYWQVFAIYFKAFARFLTFLMDKDELFTINDRIKYIMEREGHTIATFARKCGVADGTIRTMLARNNKPGYDLTVAIIKAVNQPWCDANWLVMGQQNTDDAADAGTKKLLKIVEDQQKTISDLQRTADQQRKRIDELTDRLLNDGSK